LLGALGGGLAGAGRAVLAVSEAVLAVVVVVTVVVAVPFGRALGAAVPAEIAPVEVSTCPFARLSVVGFESASAGPSVPVR
jgi:hypothetical protein